MKLSFTIDIMNNPFKAFRTMEQIKKNYTGLETIYITKCDI